MGRDHVLFVFQYSSCLAMSSQRCPQMAPLLAQENKAHRIHVLLFYDFSPREEIIVYEFNCMGIRGSWDHPRCADFLECTELTIQLLSLLIWIQSRESKGKRHMGWSPGKLGESFQESILESLRLKLGLQQRAVTAHVMLSTRKLVNSQCQWLLANDSEVVPTPHIPIFWAPGKKAGFSTNQCLQS